ncbi:MAG TPA: hypothetical protein VGO54_04840 [Bradyrhizobium sp.]|jgi:hypothetical protein|nr:hypothetical protein [Bradyrhizobium sp.]
MIEFLVVAGVAGGIVGAVAGGYSLGARYVDAKLRYEEKDIRLDQPILAPQNRRSASLGEERAA